MSFIGAAAVPDLLMVTLSVYVPPFTQITSPATAVFTTVWILPPAFTVLVQVSAAETTDGIAKIENVTKTQRAGFLKKINFIINAKY
jgi:hypothetical protein